MAAQGLVYVGPWDIVPKDITTDVLNTEYLALHNYRYGAAPILIEAEVSELAKRLHPFLVDLCCYLVSQGLVVDRAEGRIGEHPHPIELYIYSGGDIVMIQLLGLGYLPYNDRPYYKISTRALGGCMGVYGTDLLMTIIRRTIKYGGCEVCYYGGGTYCGMGMVMHAGGCSQRGVV